MVVEVEDRWDHQEGSRWGLWVRPRRCCAPLEAQPLQVLAFPSLSSAALRRQHCLDCGQCLFEGAASLASILWAAFWHKENQVDSMWRKLEKWLLLVLGYTLEVRYTRLKYFHPIYTNFERLCHFLWSCSSRYKVNNNHCTWSVLSRVYVRDCSPYHDKQRYEADRRG